ncbi:uncharacterized protein LOC119102028 isoform X1 [Pollicipes pollicipes]|uniref:uncharacterized protein LOC119093033 isoform X1 n=1 Tax=Pollicipes pollicipes TaxID=41117 RepID=UPI001884A779|nr:uncharacterized protein LOC119093033 isoform X1 [Pollicipes pollicipes]XP_037081298.1 uncharacterized protein LOC119102028 isoform X1 [Pollicipes pollicipes]
MGKLAGAWLLLALVGCCLAGDMMRKSIVYNPKTPDVFYCPLYKPKSFDDMLVKSRPLSKLCEFKGRPLPADYRSDCYGDVDETEFACAEKHRILMRLNPPGSENAIDLDDDFVYKYHGDY